LKSGPAGGENVAGRGKKGEGGFPNRRDNEKALGEKALLWGRKRNYVRGKGKEQSTSSTGGRPEGKNPQKKKKSKPHNKNKLLSFFFAVVMGERRGRGGRRKHPSEKKTLNTINLVLLPHVGRNN